MIVSVVVLIIFAGALVWARAGRELGAFRLHQRRMRAQEDAMREVDAEAGPPAPSGDSATPRDGDAEDDALSRRDQLVAR